MIAYHTRSIERLVHHHQSMPIETDECFDRSVQSYVRRLEKDQADRCWKFIHCFDKNLIQEKKDIDHIHLHRLQADLYLQLSYVSRPCQSQLCYNKHKRILQDNDCIIAMYKNLSIEN